MGKGSLNVMAAEGVSEKRMKKQGFEGGDGTSHGRITGLSTSA